MTQPRQPIRLSTYATDEPAGGPPRGITCRKCGCRHFSVVYTRHVPGGIRRRRQCRHCGKRIVTTERE